MPEAFPSPKAPSELTRQVCVISEQGLHARPAAKLAQTAQRFASAITITCGEQEVDAKSILDILTLAAGHGANLTLRATGHDAGPALDELAALFKNRFQ